jgi:outer membrane protein OmpA-like peptidoglycan-associated protein
MDEDGIHTAALHTYHLELIAESGSLDGLDAAGAAVAQDVAGSKDHPVLSRFTGARITAFSEKSFDEATLPAGPIANPDKPGPLVQPQGKISYINYRVEGAKTALEVARNYEQALAAARFTMVYQGGNTACGAGFSSFIHLSGKVTPPGSGDSLYGIYFDTGKTDIKPESKAELDEMAKLLKATPALKVYIVGHTDSEGTLAQNLDLSQRRADAVATALVQSHGITARGWRPKASRRSRPWRATPATRDARRTAAWSSSFSSSPFSRSAVTRKATCRIAQSRRRLGGAA